MNNIIPVKLITQSINASNYGSGVLISLLNEKYDLVLTCAHCLKGIESVENIELICNESYKYKIEVVEYFPKRYTGTGCNELDIGIIIINKVAVASEIYLHLKADEITNELFILGYPEILKQEDRLKAIKLKCKFQNESTSGNNIVVELDKSISETAATSEKERIDGFSGSPVYYNKNGVDTLVGLAKGVPITKDDSVAFDRVFIINIENALEYLRANGMIIYDVDYKNLKLNIKWIEDRNFKDYIDKKILIIGGSGAGKSSFINTFSKNGKLIDSSGDGQTTRTNIEYKFSLLEYKPRVQIEFLNKSKFIESRIETVKVELLEFAFRLLKKEDYNLKQELDLVIKRSMKDLKNVEKDNRYDEQLKSSISKFIDGWDDVNFSSTRTKREDIISLNLELLRILQEMDTNSSIKEIATENNRDKLRKILLMKKSFFDYREFDFIKSGELSFSKRIENLFIDEFSKFTINDLNFEENNNKIELLYGNIYELLIKELKEIYQIEGLKSNILFDSSNNNKQKISRALKVVDGESVTAFVNKVEIYDNFSNSYALIMERLKLKEVTLIDTCGLDHIETGEVPEKIVIDLFTNYNFDIKTIFYIKKLDSGKPTELEKIIPTIYSVHSNAVVYCVFSGIDIFYDEIENVILDWCDYEKRNSLPKSVKYLFNEGKIDIMEALERTKGKGVRSTRKNTIYSTLTKNLVPFCSIKNKENGFKFKENNLHYIEKIFKSIVLEEHLGLEVVPELVIESMESNQNFKISVENFIKDLFKESSIIDWTISNYGHGHYKTKNSNIDRISDKDEGELGYKGTYNDRWNYVFNKTYNDLVSYEAEKDNSFDKLLNIIKTECSADNLIGRIESAIIDYKDIFLGCPQYNTSVFMVTNSICKNCEIICFRKILLKMYNGGAYKYSIYEKPRNISDYIWLNEICNFEKGFNIIEEEIIAYFIKGLVNKLKNENIKKFDTLIQINPEIRRSYDKFLFEIKKSFLYEDFVVNLSKSVFEHLSKH